MKIHPIKTIYSFLVSFQALSLIVFVFYLIENNLDLVIPIIIDFVIPMSGLTPDIEIHFSYDFHFNIGSLIAILIVMVGVYLLSSITAVGSGISDTGTVSLKEILTFIVRYSIMNLPIVFLFSQSSILSDYIVIVSLITLLIYVLNFLIDTGGDRID